MDGPPHEQPEHILAIMPKLVGPWEQPKALHIDPLGFLTGALALFSSFYFSFLFYCGKGTECVMHRNT